MDKTLTKNAYYVHKRGPSPSKKLLVNDVEGGVISKQLHRRNNFVSLSAAKHSQTQKNLNSVRESCNITVDLSEAQPTEYNLRMHTKQSLL